VEKAGGGLGEEGFEHFDLAAMAKADSYKLLVSVVLPRPIAWVVSRGEDGGLNAAPFSFFNVLCSDPPMVAIGIAGASDRACKDTLANVRARGEFVVNMVPEELAEAMNVTATNAPAGVDETKLAGLEMAACEVVDAPRIAGSPVAMECKVFQVVEPGGSGTIVLAKVVRLHVRSTVFTNRERLHVDADQMRLIGRMHGAGAYCTTRDTFVVERKSWPLSAGDVPVHTSGLLKP
jgi:flavin reductase (DIM6/NTAB) family NADH-FMN oxidoreductase RutF